MYEGQCMIVLLFSSSAPTVRISVRSPLVIKRSARFVKGMVDCTHNNDRDGSVRVVKLNLVR